MFFRQLFDHDSWTFTYLLADEQSREAVIIDPVLDQMSLYQRLMDEYDLTLKYAIDTHVHADHVTALGALRDELGAVTIHGEGSKAACVSRFVTDGEAITFGSCHLKALATPGHTDDSYSYYLEADGKRLVFTGDTLLIRGSGRTDFQNGDAGAQYDSLFGKLLALPDDTIVYPAHDYKGMNESRIAEERVHNPRLQVADKAAYVELMGNLKMPPPKFMDVAVPANLECGRG
ncbi:MBL fold metallo-hydrolase [Kordiimonas aestuarii]|uniref:MBL fold metallo-hydrolase n=1 Tax=Kordiimonas aestuarii TaxID=1005925 RepID=UPI0021CF215B|nr:MBL fold metallo-hydrolase [Kordiimonas aestuarii]